MFRYLRNSTAILAAVLAMAATGASVASAAEFHMGSTTGTVTGSQITGQPQHVFTTSAGKVTCTVAHFTGTYTASTTTSQTLLPKWEKCTAFGFINIPYDVNGCHFTFTAAVGGQTHLVCGGKPIEITTPGCTTTIGSQTLSTTEFTNSTDTTTGKMHIIAHTNIAAITYNECGTVRNNGTYTGTTTWTAKDTVGNPVDITWT
jgi:hypothetical protein